MITVDRKKPEKDETSLGLVSTKKVTQKKYIRDN
jgi:hypothetical protein